MGLLNFFSRRDPRGRLEFVITIEKSMYVAAQDQYPDRDCNAWLAQVLLSLPDSVLLDLPHAVRREREQALVLTARFSLDRDQAALHWGLFVGLSDFRASYDRSPPPRKAAIIYNEYADGLKALDRPFIELMANSNFEQVWQERNPWTARHMPDIAKLLVAASAG